METPARKKVNMRVAVTPEQIKDLFENSADYVAYMKRMQSNLRDYFKVERLRKIFVQTVVDSPWFDFDSTAEKRNTEFRYKIRMTEKALDAGVHKSFQKEQLFAKAIHSEYLARLNVIIRDPSLHEENLRKDLPEGFLKEDFNEILSSIFSVDTQDNSEANPNFPLYVKMFV